MSSAVRSFCMLFLGALSLVACTLGREEDAVVGGVAVPVPPGMSRVEDQRMEMNIGGFSGAQETYRGRIQVDEITQFYQKEMPVRGWKPNASLVARGALLAYTKDDKSLLITVNRGDGSTVMSLTVGALAPQP